MTGPHIPSIPIEEVPAEFDTAAPRAATDSAPVLLLDVREEDEWRLGHAPGALHIPLVDVPARLDELNYDAEIFVICRQGGRSVTAVQFLESVGIEAVMVEGGMVAWQRAGRPLTGDNPDEAKVY
ncbi:rhodanese-like domain-containing protein [Nocardia acidivorans]|uniref:rhodanese-like domain-containing protein n=1 Tax=Nocardia acidivorans TaxID=404580 RepID=UPI000B005784|nr:rhodanese-like domain-containing protein [Nocardia acidivorans]